MRKWIRECRLDGFGKLMSGIDAQDIEKQAIMARLKTQSMAAMANLQRLIAADSGIRMRCRAPSLRCTVRFTHIPPD